MESLVYLILSIVLQVIAVVAALRLTKVTKYKISWILISVALLFMAGRRFIDMLFYNTTEIPEKVHNLYESLGVLTSVFITVGILLISKIFNYMQKSANYKSELKTGMIKTIIQTEEKERNRIARELHDGLGPVLTTLKMSVSSMVDSDKPVDKDILLNTERVIDEAIKAMKEISDNLSPFILEHFGLATAIKKFTEKINENKTIQISFNSNIFGKRFNTNIEIVLYRTVCELINNTLKHAKATSININLSVINKSLDLLYDDDGEGFDINESIKSKQGRGLQNMLTRIESVDGYINMEKKKKGFGAYISIKL